MGCRYNQWINRQQLVYFMRVKRNLNALLDRIALHHGFSFKAKRSYFIAVYWRLCERRANAALQEFHAQASAALRQFVY